jgi:lambda repressor-like predicted transcriptional regulator
VTLSEIDRAEILTRYRNGQSARQLAGRFGVSPDTIERALPADVRRPGEFELADLPITEAELIRRRHEGASWGALAAATGLTRSGAYRRYLRACRRVEQAHSGS